MQLSTNGSDILFDFIKIKKELEEPDSPEFAERIMAQAKEYYENDDFKNAEKLCMRAHHIYSSLYSDVPEQYRENFAACSSLMGSISEGLEKYQEAYDYYQLGCELYEQLSNNDQTFSELLADEYSNVGDTLFFRSDYDKALKYYNRSLEIFSKLREKNGKYAEDIAYCYDCIAKSESGKENYTSAIEYYEKVIEIYNSMLGKLSDSDENEKIKDLRDDLASVYNDTGYMYSCVKDFEDAEKYYLMAAELYKKLASQDAYEYTEELASQYDDLAALYEDMEKPDLAKLYHKKAQKPET